MGEGVVVHPDPLVELLDRRLVRWGFDVPAEHIKELAEAIRYAQACSNCQENNGQPCGCPDDVEPWWEAPEFAP